ncbi:SAM-dependent methyltransferase [Streptomyces sp. NPDC048248]|uniref:SAM-dependent methyltransferase n=1 Tax=Streptomyces sp. NPDC048248 TaxID=3365523 RepID=UPI003711DB74
MTASGVVDTTRAFHDAAPAEYDAHFSDGPAPRSLDRAMLSAFAGLVRDAGADRLPISGAGPAGGTLNGVRAWHLLIHTPKERHPRVCAELARVPTPGGHLLVAFQVGDAPLHLSEPRGRPVSLDFHRQQPAQIAELMRQAGLTMIAQLLREPIEGIETTPQTFLPARKADGAARIRSCTAARPSRGLCARVTR